MTITARKLERLQATWNHMAQRFGMLRGDPKSCKCEPNRGEAPAAEDCQNNFHLNVLLPSSLTYQSGTYQIHDITIFAETHNLNFLELKLRDSPFFSVQKYPGETVCIPSGNIRPTPTITSEYQVLCDAPPTGTNCGAVRSIPKRPLGGGQADSLKEGVSFVEPGGHGTMT
ncbi:hypothetical protein Y1Q_0016199 [Alligator mississippiensis]|uniref:Uncharacterized protein n=1 Tax=Alligator mississippiensis TaxID=8496 RepID=A0A151P1L5_ALLMI|nr:hypothetical protein Y1Q_0016199 [Alligator mississippiensis]